MTQNESKYSGEAELELLYRFFNEHIRAFNDVVFWTEITGDSHIFIDVFFGKRELPSIEQRITLLYNYLDEQSPTGGMSQIEQYERWLDQQS